MPKQISDHNLSEMKDLTQELQKHYLALCLLGGEDFKDWTETHFNLLWDYISAMSNAVHGFELLERCILEGCDMNAD